MRLRWVVAVGCTGALLGLAGTAQAFVPSKTDFGDSLFWDLTLTGDPHVTAGEVRYHLHSAGTADVDNGEDLNVLRAAFQAWEDVGSSSIAFTEDASSTRTQIDIDDFNNIIFRTKAQFSFFSSNPGVIAVTFTAFLNNDTAQTIGPGPQTPNFPVTRLVQPGEIVDSDIIFNDDDFGFSLCCQNPGDVNPDDDIIDLDGDSTHDPGDGEIMVPSGDELSLYAVAIHEIGHLLGLNHSPLRLNGDTPNNAIAATMYPFYFLLAETLQPDDTVAGSLQYTPVLTGLGSISGHAEFAGGQDVFGGVVTAIDPATGNPVMNVLTNKLGNYQIPGLPPGNYVVYLESLTDIFAVGNISGRSDDFYSGVDTDIDSELFDDVAVSPPLTRAAVAPGSTEFDSDATQVTVTADSDTPNIDFVVGGSSSGGSGGGSGPPGGGGGGGGGGGIGSAPQATSSGGGGGCVSVSGEAPLTSAAFLALLAPALRRRMRP